jgi:hypothetical protein
MIAKLINVGVAVQKTHRRDCRKMSDRLIGLRDLPEDIQQTIESNHRIYTRSTPSVSFKGGFWIFWAIVMLFRALSSNSCSDTSDHYQFDPNSFKIVLPDSVVKNLKNFKDTSITPYR